MYERFYGFQEKPFNIVPNPKFLYLSSKHQNALTYLEYGLMEGTGFILLTGEIGTGKTTLIRHILNEIDAAVEVAVVFNTNVNADQLLDLILQEFEVPVTSEGKARKLEALYQFLIEKYAAGKRALLIIDEAQNLGQELLEEVRLLTNIQSDDRMLLQIMLAGQSELKTKLREENLSQLNQRITVRYHLTALSREDTGQYIITRLAKAGGRADIFTEAAVDRIHTVSGGIPRMINQICDAALVYGFADEMETIIREVVEEVIRDRGEDETASRQQAEPPPADQADLEPPNDPGTAAALARIQRLETRLAELEARICQRLDALDNKTDTFRDDSGNSLAQEIARERERCDQLIRENTELKMKCEALQRLVDV